MKYTKVKTIRISETQHKTLVKMKYYNVDVAKFIREAIKEKINKEYSYLISQQKVVKDAFAISLEKALSEQNIN
jgi:hypothetical protein